MARILSLPLTSPPILLIVMSFLAWNILLLWISRLKMRSRSELDWANIRVIVLLLVYSLKSKVSFLVKLLKESADCLSALPALYLQPIFTFIQLMIFYAFWISVIVCLASARYPGTEEVRPFSYSDLTETPVTESPILSSGFNFGLPQPITNISVHTIKTFTRVEFKEEPWVRSMWWLYLIGLVWVSEFILGCQQMVIAGAVATWYFNGQRVNGRCPVGTSVKRIACYHLGSVAFGSLLITICKIPRLILSYFHAKKGPDNEDSKSWCTCCFYCFEKFIRYMNHNAYTVVAMQGIDFFPAASRAWTILASDPLRVVTYNSIGDLVLFLGKALITALTGSVALLVFKSQTDLHFYAAPVLLVCVFSFFISHCVISVYEIVIDTLYLCICEDQDINGENGVWRKSKLPHVKHSATEMSPINTNQITM